MPSTDRECTLELFKKIVNTPALPLAVEGWNALNKQGYTESGEVMIHWDHCAILARDPAGLASGVLTFQHLEWCSTINTCIAYVLPNKRRRGIHTKMWRLLVDFARAEKVVHISSGVHEANLESQWVHNVQKRQQYGRLYRYAIPKEGY
jgi:GNAT superfamily N-acetyltransferase